MSAYATHQLALAGQSVRRASSERTRTTSAAPGGESSLLETLIDRLAERVAERLAVVGPAQASGGEDEWLDSRHAAEYLGIHRDTLRKLAAERAIPSEQDGPNCKLYFCRRDLDAWRRGGGRPRHLGTTLGRAA